MRRSPAKCKPRTAFALRYIDNLNGWLRNMAGVLNWERNVSNPNSGYFGVRGMLRR